MQSEVRTIGGEPRLVINGEPAPRAIGFCHPGHVGDFTRAGIYIYTMVLGGRPTFWLGPGEYDFTAADAALAPYVEQDPEALLIPRIAFGSAEREWWADAFPSEVTVALDVETELPEPYPTDDAYAYHSFASLVWRREAGRALAALIEHLEGSALGERIVGYHIAGGRTQEWFAWHNVNPTALEDYSSAMRDEFRRWLRGRYGSDDGLQAAWCDPRVTLGAAQILAPRHRTKGTAGSFFDPRGSQPAIDYALCFSDTVADAMLDLCRVAKNAVGGRKVVGAFHGYLWTNEDLLGPVRNGHLSVRRVLESPDVDFIACPYHYDNRGVGGYNAPQAVLNSVKAAGKLLFSEADTVTHRFTLDRPWFNCVTRPADPEGTVHLLRRDFAQAAAAGISMWWMDIADQGLFADPESIEFMRRAPELESEQTGPAADVGVFADADSFAYVEPGHPLLPHLLGEQRQFEMSRMGTPFDTWLLDDFVSGRAPLYRLNMFLNPFRVTGEARTAIRRRLCGSGCWAVWYHAAGLIDEHGASIENCTALTGLRLGASEEIADIRVRTLSGHPLLDGVASGTLYGMCVQEEQRAPLFVRYPQKRGVSPVPWCDDPDAVVLGVLDWDGPEWAGLALKDADGFASVWSAAPVIPWRILRNAARLAGAHVYCESGDVIYAGRGLLGIHAVTSGKKQLSLPDGMTARSTDDPDPLGAAPELDMAVGETSILRLVPNHP